MQELKPQLHLTDGIWFIDNSTMSNITSCLRKASYAVGMKLRQVKPQTALRFGGIIHNALEARYKFGPNVTPEAEDASMQALADGFSQWSPDEGDFRTLEQAINCIQMYNVKYMTEEFKILSIDNHEGVETPFALPLTTIKPTSPLPVVNNNNPTMWEDEILVMFTGRIDMVIEDPIYGIMPFDHKTTSVGGAYAFSQFYTDFQFKGYCWALTQLLGLPKHPAGATINLLINRKPTRTGKSIEFIRDVIDFHPSVIDEWRASFISNLRLYVDALASDNFPMQTQMCVHKYGLCEFYDVCKLPVTQRGTMLASNLYEENNWSPI